MACGLPVAAYPVTGPLDLIGGSDAGALSSRAFGSRATAIRWQPCLRIEIAPDTLRLVAAR
jgi:hypothetical protein